MVAIKTIKVKRFIQRMTDTNPAGKGLHLPLLAFRVLLSLELMYAHGLKKLGIGVAEAEQVPNPLHLPETLNNLFALSANLIFPVFVILGLFTRLAVLPILAVTLTGYFLLHLHDAPLIKDPPFMYSLSFLLVFFLGAGKYSLDHKIAKK
jgi:putative oxidoreductase